MGGWMSVSEQMDEWVDDDWMVKFMDESFEWKKSGQRIEMRMEAVEHGD